jgi:hypothetical protein
MSQPKPRRKNQIEPLDWKELADAPALRGLEEALTPLRELQDNGRDVGLRLVHDGATEGLTTSRGQPAVVITPLATDRFLDLLVELTGCNAG